MSNLAQHYGNPISSLQTAETEGFDSLVSLALDMRWSWNHTADQLWSQLDPALWNETHNPWLVIQSVSDDQVKHLLSSPSFRAQLDAIIKERQEDDSQPGWFKTNHPDTALKTTAYFSMEFM